MSDPGVTISTGQAIAALVFLVSTIGSLLAVIRHLYSDANVKLERRIERMEEEITERNRASERYVDALERAVDVMSRTTGVTEEVLRTTPTGRRSRTGGS